MVAELTVLNLAIALTQLISLMAHFKCHLSVPTLQDISMIVSMSVLFMGGCSWSTVFQDILARIFTSVLFREAWSCPRMSILSSVHAVVDVMCFMPAYKVVCLDF